MQTIKKDLVDLFELDKLSPEKMNETVERLSRLIFQAVLARVLPVMSEEKLEEYDRLVDSEEAGEKIFSFLQTNVSDLDKIIKEESEDLRKEIAGEFEEAGV